MQFYGTHFMVNLVIMRHGEAQAHAASDQERALTLTGEAEAKQMALWLNTAYAAFDQIWTSPYLRTRQTAELMLAQQPNSCTLSVLPELVPDANAQRVKDQLDLLLAQQPNARVLMVSHMPLVSFLVEAFTVPGQAPIFGTASVSCIAYEPTRGGKLVEKNGPLEMALLSGT